MKKLLLIFTLLFSTLMFSTPSYGEWMEVSSSGNGEQTFYVDFDRIRKHGGYVYFWRLGDYLKPNSAGNLSSELYFQGDCELFRYKGLNWFFHKEPMGEGPAQISNDADKEWNYPPPNSVDEIILKKVCEYVN